MVVSVGGFYPGFNPEPARIPALRRVGLAMDNPMPIIEIRAEGYFAVTSNSIQFGGRLEIGISLGIEAHGFVQVDAIVQFRPFHFEARGGGRLRRLAPAASASPRCTLEGSISGPGPDRRSTGSLSIDVFLFSISWDETFTLGSGPGDGSAAARGCSTSSPRSCGPANVHADRTGDHVVLEPRPGRSRRGGRPADRLRCLAQRRAPLGVLIERVDGRPLDGAQGVTVAGPPVTDVFSPGSYRALTDAEALNGPRSTCCRRVPCCPHRRPRPRRLSPTIARSR